jgi:nicotinate-nucleotide adenylyltransferase
VVPPRVAMSGIEWIRPVDGARAAVLLGAFDPPTNAHVALVRAAGDRLGIPGAFCPTTVALARGADRLLELKDRLALLEQIADAEGFGLALADHGTYLDVARALRQTGIDATFVVGSDKLPQLRDPSFYENGAAGVAATFAEVSFLVVARLGAPPDPMPHVDAADVFADMKEAAISATEVRRLLRDGESVAALVPPVVAAALEGYTARG